MKHVYSFVLVATVLLLSSCGSNDNNCPSGMNTTNPNCPNYSPYAYNQPPTTNPYPTQSPYPYYPQPNNTYPYPNNTNPYPNTQPPANYGYPCQPGTPYCVNGYYNPPR